MSSFLKSITEKDWACVIMAIFYAIFHKYAIPKHKVPDTLGKTENPTNTALPRGLRNNNPLNIRHNKDYFQGEIKGTDKSFKTFSCMPYGYRAGFVILHTYLMRGDNTIEKIIARWAPPIENDTEKYIAFVERYTGIIRHKELTATHGADYVQIVSAMSFMENGKNADPSEIKAGFNLQSRIS